MRAPSVPDMADICGAPLHYGVIAALFGLSPETAENAVRGWYEAWQYPPRVCFIRVPYREGGRAGLGRAAASTISVTDGA